MQHGFNGFRALRAVGFKQFLAGGSIRFSIRFRPMLLTAMAVVVGGSVILFDPIFQGLAISLMAGEIASLLLSRMAVPIIYYLSMRKSRKAGAGSGPVAATEV